MLRIKDPAVSVPFYEKTSVLNCCIRPTSRNFSLFFWASHDLVRAGLSWDEGEEKLEYEGQSASS